MEIFDVSKHGGLIKNKKACYVNCQSQDDSTSFMTMLQSMGYKWAEGQAPLDFQHYERFRESTVYKLDNKKITMSSLSNAAQQAGDNILIYNRAAIAESYRFQTFCPSVNPDLAKKPLVIRCMDHPTARDFLAYCKNQKIRWQDGDDAEDYLSSLTSRLGPDSCFHIKNGKLSFGMLAYFLIEGHTVYEFMASPPSEEDRIVDIIQEIFD